MIELSKFPVIGFDTETTGLSCLTDRIFTFSVSTPDGNDFAFDLRDNRSALDWLRAELPRCKKVAIHNAKFDLSFLKRERIVLRPDQVDCTMVRAALLDEHLMSYSLDDLGLRYLGVRKEDIWQEMADIFGGRPTKNAQIANLPRAPFSLIAKYAKRDSRMHLDLWHYQQPIIEGSNLGPVLAMEMELLHVLMRMEMGGVRVDIDAAEEAVAKLDVACAEKQYELNRYAGREINPNPSNSIKELFEPKQDHLGQWVLRDGTIAVSTDAGNPSIDAECLRRMKDPAAAMILDLRKLLKCRDTFLKGHVIASNVDGYVHTNFNQTKSEEGGTGTGRLSSSGPALQQIPSRDKQIASIVRPLFVPDIGQEWISCDWQSFEVRMFAHYINDPKVNDTFRDNPMTDFHQLVADLTGLPRSPRFAGDPNAKQLNLAAIFGMGRGRLAAEMGMPYTIENMRNGKQYLKAGPEAEEVIERYNTMLPGVSRMSREAANVAKSRGYVRTYLGRHIHFPNGQFTHKAAGLIYQGSSADAMKLKLIEVDKLLRDTEARILLTVHDEINISAPKGDKALQAKIKYALESFGPHDKMHLRIPIICALGAGENWHVAGK